MWKEKQANVDVIDIPENTVRHLLIYPKWQGVEHRPKSVVN